jgi:hypothetical protein
MSAAAASRRKQAKPQKVAGGEKDKRSHLAKTSSPVPLSIEEQFNQQILGSLDKTFFKKESNNASVITVSFK